MTTLTEARMHLMDCATRVHSARDAHNETAHRLALRDLEIAREDFYLVHARYDECGCDTCVHPRRLHVHTVTGVWGCTADGCHCERYEGPT